MRKHRVAGRLILHAYKESMTNWLMLNVSISFFQHVLEIIHIDSELLDTLRR